MKRMRFYIYAGIAAIAAYVQPLSAQPYASNYGPQDCATGLSFSAEYLYWQVSQDQMAYASRSPGGIQAVINAITNSPPLLIDLAVTTYEPRFKWQSGLRLGAGYKLPCSGWDTKLFWTHLNQHNNSSIFDPTEGIIPITMPSAALIGIISSNNPTLLSGATSSWKLNLDTLDLQLGRTWYASQNVTLRHFLGVKAAIIRQSQSIEYFGFLIDQLATQAHNKKDNNFKGIGPSIGLNSAWEFAPKWNISSGISGSLLYGKFNSGITTDVALDPNDIHVNFNQNRPSRIRPVMDAYLGIGWTTDLTCSCALSVAFLYEMQYWWNQWQPSASEVTAIIGAGNSPQGDLMLQGLTARVSLAF